MRNIRIAIIGLGYVGLPLAIEFAKKYKTVGFDGNMENKKYFEEVNESDEK
jgi:UDP-N-acetyl-D-galactosamine dehydrogenase